MAGMVLGLVGYILPTVVVSSRATSRQRMLRESFPDALDMLLMCVEAGVGLDEAIARVGEELKLNHPLLAWHFELLSAELRAGKNRDAAFRALSDRIGIDEIQSFVSLIVQTEALGTSMADTLRSMSDDMRQRRLLRAEEMAQKVSTKLSMLLMVFILPVLLMVIMAPAMLSAMRNFKGH
jgi:tight adherence protein C